MTGNTVTNVRMKFNYNRLHIDEALGDFQQCDNKNKNICMNPVWVLKQVAVVV